MTGFHAENGIPPPIRAADKTKGAFLRDGRKNEILDKGISLIQSGQSKRKSAKEIAPEYYLNWDRFPHMQEERLKTLSYAMTERMKQIKK